VPSWNELLAEFGAVQATGDAAHVQQWFNQGFQTSLREIAALRGDRHVMLYGSGFLQKPNVPADHLSITHEDLNGFMGAIYGMNVAKGLTLLLHTPGGVTNAAESIVAYLRSKFTDVEVIVPALAMSAGTMISLASERIVMGRQSQLGPIDPQLVGGGRQVSARAVTEQFERASQEVLGDPATGTPGNLDAAHLWAPILQSLGPALLQEAQNALDYSERMVGEWVAKYMLKMWPDADSKGRQVAKHFNDASTHKSHGRRIGRDEARLQGVVVEDLERNQALQESVLTAYHMMTIMFEQSLTTKVLWTDTGTTWMKQWAGQITPLPAG
jgi:hypothetical protein